MVPKWYARIVAIFNGENFDNMLEVGGEVGNASRAVLMPDWRLLS